MEANPPYSPRGQLPRRRLHPPPLQQRRLQPRRLRLQSLFPGLQELLRSRRHRRHHQALHRRHAVQHQRRNPKRHPDLHYPQVPAKRRGSPTRCLRRRHPHDGEVQRVGSRGGDVRKSDHHGEGPREGKYVLPSSPSSPCSPTHHLISQTLIPNPLTSPKSGPHLRHLERRHRLHELAGLRQQRPLLRHRGQPRAHHQGEPHHARRLLQHPLGRHRVHV